MTTKVFIDPTSKIQYSSFYIQGLYEIFGRKNVSFSGKYFRELKRRTESHSYDHYMAFVVIKGRDNIHKIIIDFRDKVSIKESAYYWCDKYAKINFNKELTDGRFHKKIISIPPGFGIKIWNFRETAYNCICNLIKCRFLTPVSINKFIRDYYLQFKRSRLENYFSGNYHESSFSLSNKPYVFFISSLWSNKLITGTNLWRKTFIEYCKLSNVDFEGGLFALESHPLYGEFKEHVFSNQYPVDVYINKTIKSTFVFNTPAVFNCHGWKLGEFLAMGKAIISTKLFNELPEPLIHGKNIHFVSDFEELNGAIKLILSDSSYKNLLETGAKTYYSKYGQPEKVLDYILKK